MERLRNFLFTSFTVENHRENFILNSKLRYMIYSVEKCPKTERLHIQGYAELHEQTRFNTVRKMFPEGTHFDPRQGTQAQAIAYCSKEESHVEGPFIHGTPHVQGKRNDIETFVKDIPKSTELEIIEKHPECYVKYHRVIDRVKYLNEIDRNWKTEVIVYWGDPGSGKTRRVFEECPDVHPIKYTNGFIIGYNNEKNVLFDDFDSQTMPRELFLTLTDRYKCVVNIKGGEKKWNPQRIYITSNTDPQFWFDGSKAVTRRLDKVENIFVSNVSVSEVK